MANNFGQNWSSVGNSMLQGVQTLGALVAPSATPQMIDQQAQATQQAAKPRAKTSSTQDTSNTPTMPSPAEDPVKFANAQILLSILPQMVQHASDAYAQTGKVPDASVAFSPDHSALMGGLAMAAQQNPNAQPKIVPPQSATTPSGYDPETGNMQEAGWVNRGLQGLAHGGVLGMLGGLVGPTVGQQMGATEQAQKLSGKEPIQPVQRATVKALEAEALMKGEIAKSFAKGAEVVKLGDQTFLKVPDTTGLKYTEIDTAQRAKLALASLDEQAQKIQEQIKTELEVQKQSRGVLGVIPTKMPKVDALKKKLELINNNRQVLTDSFSEKVGNKDSSGIQEGATATNPKTGQKLTYKGGVWQ